MSTVQTKLNGEAKHFGRGRPTKYDPKFVKAAKKLAELGATDADLATAFDTSIETIRRWSVRCCVMRAAAVLSIDEAR
jgi:hypothetical protein